MGMDLITASLAKRRDTKLDFAAAIGWLKTIDADLLVATETGDNILCDHETNEDGEFEDEAKEEVRAAFLTAVDDLNQSLSQGWRDQDFIEFGEWTIIVGGGSSWGDSPGPTFDAMVTLMQVPDALKLIGFDWPETEVQ